MSRKSLLGVLAVVLLVAVVSAAYFFRRSTFNPAQNFGNEPVELSGAFTGPAAANTSADFLTLGRVIRGSVDHWTEPKDHQLFVSAQANWPNDEPRLTEVFSLLPQTEYLCWPSTFVNGDGVEAQIKDTVYLLDNNHKLFTPGQKPLSYEEAIQQFHEGASLIIALQEPFATNKVNTAFQVVMVGCQ